MSLGTPHYMSPEQAMGEREITARSDVYALGCVLYEMLTGDPPFTGSTAQAIVARVVTEHPRSLTSQRHTIPPQVEAAVLTALEKLPADRFGTAAEFAAALGDPNFASRATVATGISRAAATGFATNARRLIAGLVAVSLVLGVLAVWGWSRPKPPAPVIRYSMGLPPDQAMRQGIPGANLAFSPDGSRLVYVGPGEGGDQLWVRDRDRLDATPLPGTLGAISPWFSPDGQRIAFSAGANFDLKIVPVTGGPPITLATPGGASVAAWPGAPTAGSTLTRPPASVGSGPMVERLSHLSRSIPPAARSVMPGRQRSRTARGSSTVPGAMSTRPTSTSWRSTSRRVNATS